MAMGLFHLRIWHGPKEQFGHSKNTYCEGLQPNNQTTCVNNQILV